MSFLNPALLLGLAAAAVPILIHLLNLRRRKQMDFSSLMLLREIERSSLRRFKVRQWLLLLLRSLVIFFLVFSFSKPIISGYLAGSDFASRTKTSAFILIDASPSMTYTDGSADVWRQTKAAAIKALENLSAQDEIFLSLSAEDAASVAPLSYAEARQKIIQAEPAAAARPSEERLRGALATLGTSRHFNREIYLISDFQQSGFAAADTGTADESLRERYKEIKFYAVNVSPQSKQNVGVVRTELLTKILEPGKSVRVRATLVLHANLNTTSDTNIDSLASPQRLTQSTRVRLYFNDKLAAEDNLELISGQPAEITLSATPAATGIITARVECDADYLEADNKRFFTFFIPERLRLLIAYSNPQDISYLKLALESFQNRNFFDLALATESSLDARDFNRFDAVVLCGLSQVSAGATEKLRQYHRQGGGVIFFAAAKQNYLPDNQLLAALGGGTLTAQPAAPAAVETIDTRSLIFEGIYDRRKGAPRNAPGNDERIEVFSAPRYQKSVRESAVMATAGGQSVMTVSRLAAEGSLVLFTLLPVPQSSTLAVQPLFAPLMFRSIFYVSSKSQAAASYTVGQTGELNLSADGRLSGGAAPAGLTVRKPSGKTFVAVTAARRNETKLLIDPSLYDEAGIYEVITASSGAGESTSSARLKLAINLPAPESETRSMASGKIKAAAVKTGLDGKNVFYTDAATSAEKVAEMISGSRFGFGIWKYLAGLAAICLVAESLLSRRSQA
ncbi:MAG: BatA domain-containing protein [Rhizobacter sp.]|nr:BatA domain-containing protein [Chlorobiales bacterium]